MRCRQCSSELTGRQRAYCSKSCQRRYEYQQYSQAYKDRAKRNREERKARDPEGLRAYNRERARRLYQSDPEKARAKKRAAYWKDPASRRAAARTFYWKNPDPYRQRALARIAADPEAHRAYQRQRYYSTSPDVRYYRSRASRLRRLEKIKAYEAANIERRRMYVITRRTRLRRNGGVYTRAEWVALCAQHHNRCAACGLAKRLTPDHIVPLCLGGHSDISNIQPLCLRCNKRKARRVIDYRRRVPA